MTTTQHRQDTPAPLDEPTYEQTLRTLSEASVNRYFNAFVDVPWDDPAFATVPDDPRWVLPAIDPIGAHPWYQSLSTDEQIRVGRHRLTATMKTGSQFEQLLLLGGTQFLMRVGNGNPEFRYFMHELTEETHHIQMFQEFTNRVCPEVSGAPKWLMLAIPWVARLGSLTPALFFGIILAGEEPIDHLQKDVLRYGNPHPLMERVMAIHAAEEARHIGFAHAWLEEHTAGLGTGSRLALGVLTALAMRLGYDAIVIPSAADRRAMGMPASVAREIFGTEAAKKVRRDVCADVRMLYRRIGILTPATRWAWKALGVDGRPSRYRGELASS